MKAILISLSLVALISCSSDSSDSSDSSSSTEDPVCFPRQVDTGGERTVMEALFKGKLELRGRCLVAGSGPDSYLIIWPPNFTLDTTTNPYRVLNEKGNVVAEVGTEIAMGGGTVDSIGRMEGIEGGADQLCCDGPYWIVGDMGDPGLASERPNPKGTMLALQNKGDIDFDSVRIGVQNSADGQGGQTIIDVGPIKAGETTQYFDLPLLYRYSYIRIIARGTEHLFQPIDYVGEEAMVTGRYTYGLTLNGEQVEIEFIKD